MKKSYIYRRKDNLIDMLISDHFWLKVVVADGATGGGDYGVRIFRTRFLVADPTPASDSSAAIATALIAEINAGSELVEAFSGAAGNEVLIRFDRLGQVPSSDNYEATTTDGEGSISVSRAYPQSYTVKNASNWDGVFADMQAVPRPGGFVSSTVRKYQDAYRIDAGQLKHRTRFLFDPSDYSVTDTDVSFFQISTVVDGQEIDEGPIEIVMTADQALDVGEDALLLTGTVPQAASFSDGLYLQFPIRSSSFEIRNKGANDLRFAFKSGQAEWVLEPGDSFSDARVNITGFTLRGDGGSTDVEIYTTILTSKFIA